MAKIIEAVAKEEVERSVDTEQAFRTNGHAKARQSSSTAA